MWCCGGGGAARSSILYSLLNRGSPGPARTRTRTRTGSRACSCASGGRLAAARAPRLLFKAASQVLAKSFRFVKNVPCFRGLPAEDQLRLVRRSWAPLLVLGLAQDSVDLDTVETRRSSLLRGILTHRAPRDPGVPAGHVDGIKLFLLRCRGLRISGKEHAFLKGAVLFSPGTQLECGEYVQALQKEAERALYQHVRTVHRGDGARVGRLRAILSQLRSLDPDAVAGLFFRPVTGTGSVDRHVLAMFYEREI